MTEIMGKKYNERNVNYNGYLKSGGTILEQFIYKRNIKRFVECLEHVNVHEVNHYGDNLLHISIMTDNLLFVKYLLENHEYMLYMKNYEGYSPYDLGVLYASTDSIKYILDKNILSFNKIIYNSRKYIRILPVENYNNIAIFDTFYEKYKICGFIKSIIFIYGPNFLDRVLKIFKMSYNKYDIRFNKDKNCTLPLLRIEVEYKKGTFAPQLVL